jgi:hypothetical protein
MKVMQMCSEMSENEIQTTGHHPKRRTERKKPLYSSIDIHIATSSTYSERASKANDGVFRGNINRTTWKGLQARDRRDVDHHATLASFILTHVLEPQ